MARRRARSAVEETAFNLQREATDAERARRWMMMGKILLPKFYSGAW